MSADWVRGANRCKALKMREKKKKREVLKVRISLKSDARASHAFQMNSGLGLGLGRCCDCGCCGAAPHCAVCARGMRKGWAGRGGVDPSHAKF